MYAAGAGWKKVAAWLLSAILLLWVLALFATIGLSPAVATQGAGGEVHAPGQVQSAAGLALAADLKSTEYTSPAALKESTEGQRSDDTTSTPGPGIDLTLGAETVTEVPTPDPPETPPPDGGVAHVGEQTQSNPDEFGTPEHQPVPSPQDKDPPQPDQPPPITEEPETPSPVVDPPETSPPESNVDAEDDGTPVKPEPIETQTPKHDPPQDRDPAQVEKQPPESSAGGKKPIPSQPPSDPRPPIPRPHAGYAPAPASPHTQGFQRDTTAGPHSPRGLHGTIAARGGLIGDNYPARYQALPLFPVVWDEWNFAHRQCTSFVAWRLQQVNGVPFANSSLGVARWGNAGEWGNAARKAGFRVDNTPALGAVAYNEPFHNGTGSAGHVAWVAKVLDDDHIVIEEYNYLFPGGKYHARTVPKEAFSGYIHIRDLAEPPSLPDEKAQDLTTHKADTQPTDWTLQSSATPWQPRTFGQFWFEDHTEPADAFVCARTSPHGEHFRGNLPVFSLCWVLSYFPHLYDPSVWPQSAGPPIALTHATQISLSPGASHSTLRPDEADAMTPQQFLGTVASFCALATLPACGASEPYTFTTIDELQQTFIEAGGICEEWQVGSQQGKWIAFGNCDTTGATLSLYASVDARDDMIHQLQGGQSLHSHALVGPNWIITTDADASFAEEMGADVITLS